MTTKLCIDCQWIGSTRTPDDPFCNHPSVPKSLVNGKTETRCHDNRHNAAICGIEGKLFKAKKKKEAPPAPPAPPTSPSPPSMPWGQTASLKKKAQEEHWPPPQQKPVSGKGATKDFPTVSDRAAQLIKKKAKSK